MTLRKIDNHYLIFPQLLRFHLLHCRLKTSGGQLLSALIQRHQFLRKYGGTRRIVLQQ